MKCLITLAALSLLIASPLAAVAQGGPPPGGDGPPPEMRAKMEKLRADTRTAAFNALSPEHQKAVQSVIDQVVAGKIKDPREASEQIDKLLTPDENKSVTAIAQKALESLKPPGPPPGAPPPPGGGGGRHGGPPQMNDAGHVFLFVSLTREQMRSLMPPPNGPPPPNK